MISVNMLMGKTGSYEKKCGLGELNPDETGIMYSVSEQL